MNDGTTFSLSPEKRIEIMSQFGDICNICGEEPGVCLDHCHETGEFRGVLCSGCNSGLGFFRDRIESLQNAIKYLESS